MASVQVYIQITGGPRLSLQSDYAESIASLKQRVFELTGMPVADQAFTYENFPMADILVVGDFIFADGATIVVTGPYVATTLPETTTTVAPATTTTIAAVSTLPVTTAAATAGGHIPATGGGFPTSGLALALIVVGVAIVRSVRRTAR